MYKWFLAARYLRTKLIALFGVASVTLCVAMVLVVMSVMGGFLDTIRERSRGLHAEIVLEGGTLQGFPLYEEFGRYLDQQLRDVVRISTPVIYTYGIFRVPATTYTKPARVLGVRLDEYRKVNDFGNGLYYARYYPGTTHLGPQAMPLAGPTADGMLKLPDEWEQANARWRDGESDPNALAAYDKTPFETSLYPAIVPSVIGERAFAVQLEGPGYAGPEHPGLIIGYDVLNDRGRDGSFNRYVARGAPVALTLMPLSPTGNPTGEPPVRLAMRYADDSRTGIYEIDSLCVYADFDLLQQKLAMDPQTLVDGGFSRPRTNQFLIGLHDGADLDQSKERIEAAWLTFLNSISEGLSPMDLRALDFVEVYTWEDMQRQFIAAVEKERVLVTMLFSVISLVAIALVGCIFYMIVEKKTRDIGILKALGASGQGVAGLFILYAGAVGVVGSTLGVVLGTLFVRNVNDIQDYLASLNPELRVWSPDVYSFDRIPEVVNSSDALWIASIAVVASIVGSLIPAIIAGRVWPVEALRYE